jgi:homoserine dehydrogenase
MTKSGAAFADVLKSAQQKGFAEADPTLDIDGTDTAHKLTILAGLAFGCRIEMKDISIEGIQGVEIEDIRNAQEMG